ncbi:MAG: hypothetical protein IJ189_09995 [Clostridia bacterium]|nr:hypothetical protein [Clostridia bacterium]
MNGIERKDIHQEWAHAGIVKVGNYCFLSYCVGNVGREAGLQFQADAVAYCGE